MGSSAMEERRVSAASWRRFVAWTLLWWPGVVGSAAGLFWVGRLSFHAASRVGLYGVSVWLNGWLLALLSPSLPWQQRFHDCIALWGLSYGLTNLVWEVPWIFFSRGPLLDDLATPALLAAGGERMREEGLLGMFRWMLASF